MTRIQVLPLTTETVGSVSSTPFVLIIDKVGDEFKPEDWERLKADTGARLVLVVDGTLDVANLDEELHQAAQAAVERALLPERPISVP